MRAARRVAAVGIAGLAVAALAGVSPAAAKGPTVDLELGAKGIWAGQPGADLVRVDPWRGRAATTVPGVRGAWGVAVGRGRVWTIGGRVLTVVDQDRDRVIRRTRLSIDPASIAVGNRSVWVAGSERRERRWRSVLLRVDPQTLEEVGRFHLGRRPAPGLAFAAGAIWLDLPRSYRRRRSILVGIEESDGTMRAHRRLRGPTLAIAATTDAIWVALVRRRKPGARLLRLNASTGRREAIFSGPQTPLLGGLAADDSVVWAADACGNAGPVCPVNLASITAYDADSGEVVGGPYLVSGERSEEPQFIAGVTDFGPRSAAVALTSGRGKLRLAIFSARAGLVREIEL